METPQNDHINYNGSWERRGRSPVAAVIAGLIGIGIIYSYGQTFLVTIAVLAQGTAEHAADHAENSFAWLAHQSEHTKNPIRISLLISQYLLMLLPTIWLVRKWHTVDVRKYIRFRGAPLASTLLAIIATFFFFPANVYISGFFIDALRVPQELIEINHIFVTASNGGELLLLIVVIGITPALCEEVFFRGYAQRTFERKIGWKSILVAGFIFGLYHMQPLGLISLSGLGILFGYLYYESRSLLPCMAAHFTNNVLAVMLFASPEAIGNIIVDQDAFTFGMMMASLPLAIASLYLFRMSVRSFKQHP